MKQLLIWFSKIRLILQDISLLDFIKSLIAALLLRFLKPWVTIRIAEIDSSRLGYFAFEPELYLCRKHAEHAPRPTLDWFYHKGPICNNQLRTMWERTIPFIQGGKYIDQVSQLLPDASTHTINLALDPIENTNELLKNSLCHLAFTPEEEKLGYAKLLTIGINQQDPFICFINRDALYLKKHLGNENWEFHNYRDSNINNYLSAAEIMTTRGYWAIRLGALVEEPLGVSNTKIIDYALDYREDFLDIFLLAKCHFLISQNSGPYVLSAVFRRPVAFVNLSPFFGTNGFFNDDDLFIPKKYFIVNEQRLMSFQEILASGAGDFLRGAEFLDAGLKLIENTPEEICELSVEMEERLSGRWVGRPEDENLWERLVNLLQNAKPGYRIPKIGANFLRRHAHLLD